MRTIHANRQHSIQFRQSENSSLKYIVNWAGFTGFDIANSEWSSDGATISSAANTAHEASAVIAAGPGTYYVTNKVTFNNAPASVDERTFVLHVTDKYGNYAAERDYR